MIFMQKVWIVPDVVPSTRPQHLEIRDSFEVSEYRFISRVGRS